MLYGGVYDARGRPVCLGKVRMDYVRTDPESNLRALGPLPRFLPAWGSGCTARG